MASTQIKASHFSPDIQEFIRLLHTHRVQYVIAGGEAVIHYGYARLTGDVDFFYNAHPSNTERLFQALIAFWDGSIPGIHSAVELQAPGLILQFGRPPNRIDLLNKIDGITFDETWPSRREVLMVSPTGETPLYYIGLRPLIINKQASGRPKDLEDLSYLEKALQESDE